MAPDRRQTGLAIFLLAVGALIAASLLTGGPATRAEGASAPGNRARGAKVFVAAGCFQCHSLRAVGSRSAVGPDLDRLRPSVARVVRQVTRGSADMPAYRGVIPSRAVRDVAAYVAWATRRTPPSR
jgi:mono/diheme cytochrome c family protein